MSNRRERTILPQDILLGESSTQSFKQINLFTEVA
jgi:hypothetical protein